MTLYPGATANINLCCIKNKAPESLLINLGLKCKLDSCAEPHTPSEHARTLIHTVHAAIKPVLTKTKPQDSVL